MRTPGGSKSKNVTKPLSKPIIKQVTEQEALDTKVHRISQLSKKMSRIPSSVDHIQAFSTTLPHLLLVKLLDQVDVPNALSLFRTTHATVHVGQIKSLDRTALDMLSKHLQKGAFLSLDPTIIQDGTPPSTKKVYTKVDYRIVEFIAEFLACAYLKRFEIGTQNPRPKLIAEQLLSIQTAAGNLHQALNEASSLAHGELKHRLEYPWPLNANTNDVQALWKKHQGDGTHSKRQKISNQFYPPVVSLNLSGAAFDASLIDSLKTLSDAAHQAIRRLPDDKGGHVKGAYDSVGKYAKEFLVRESVLILKSLKLKAGTHKGGPLSTFISLVHSCVFPKSEEGAWADDYAERAKQYRYEDVWTDSGHLESAMTNSPLKADLS